MSQVSRDFKQKIHKQRQKEAKYSAEKRKEREAYVSNNK